MKPINSQSSIAIIGLGYVGLPLAIEFAKQYPVTGFDINQNRINELKSGIDHTLEANQQELIPLITLAQEKQGLFFSHDQTVLQNCEVFIITVPTPVDQFNNPDLTPIIKASQMVAQQMKKGAVVIYESTVYPGCTEEVCVPLLEEYSGLTYNVDFFCGYSPERINPGDKTRTLTKIKKVTSGSTPEAAILINELYQCIIPAGTHLAKSIKVAEAAKVIENAQRDINIAFVNELAKIFCLLGIDTQDVLEAASTKWNFLPFKPGLVGGHCIGVDPYYLAQKAAAVGYYPEIILSGRRINDSMGTYIADRVIKLMLKKEIRITEAKILVLGITFKENCPDVRNTKVIDIIKELQSYKTEVTIVDPWANPEEVWREYGLNSKNELPFSETFDAIILAVPHQQFSTYNFKQILKSTSVLFDVKGFLEPEASDARL